MRVLFLNDSGTTGGAAIAAVRLATALADAGNDVAWVVGSSPPPDWRAWCFRSLGFGGRLAARCGEGARRLAVARVILGAVRDYRPDWISVHNIHQFGLDPALPGALSRFAPVVCTLHDMWPFTGTCAYSGGCDAYASACHARCPRAQEYPALPAHRVPTAFARRGQAYARAPRLAFAAPSQWILSEGRRGVLRGRPARVIRNSVDLAAFRPIPRDAARHALGLPTDRLIVLAPPASGDRRKGGDIWADAATLLADHRPLTVSLGGEPGPERLAIARTTDPRLLNLVYNAADLHVLPTREDNLPNVLLEAAAAGTPSVATDVGGVPEAVAEGVSGWLVPPENAAALAEAVRRAAAEIAAAGDKLRASCRSFAESRFSAGEQAAAYTDLAASLASTPEEFPSPQGRMASPAC